MGTVNGILSLFCAAFTLVLVFGLQDQQRIRPSKDAGIFHLMLIAAFIALLSNGIGWLCFSSNPVLFRVLISVAVVVLILLLAAYSDYVICLLKPENPLSRNIKRINRVLCVFLAVFWTINAVHPFFFDFRTVNFIFGPWMIPFVAAAMTVILSAVFLIVINRKKVGRWQFVVMLTLPLLLIISYLPNFWSTELRLFFPTIFLVLLANYVRLYNIQYLTLNKQREKVQNMRVRAMAECMKPHYIHNVLTSIYYLCETDPHVAQQAVGAFSDYMRSVLENLDTDGLVPFYQEMHTVQNYLSLEHMRFGDRYRVSFQIDTDDFMLPPFCVQPLVENALKHGMGQSDLVGEIVIESYETETDHVIVVRDNCGGFDVEQFHDEQSGFGLRYVQQILSMTVGGSMTIESEVGTGTSVTLRIPKKEE